MVGGQVSDRWAGWGGGGEQLFFFRLKFGR